MCVRCVQISQFSGTIKIEWQHVGRSIRVYWRYTSVSFMCVFRPTHTLTQMHSSYMITLFYGCHGNQHIGLKQTKIPTRVYYVLPIFITSSSEWSALFITTDVPLWHRWVSDTRSVLLNYVPFYSHIQRNNGFFKTVCVCVFHIFTPAP